MKGLIVEGHDCCGKTHIAKALAKELNWHYFKHSHQITWFHESDRGFIYKEAMFFIDFLQQIELRKDGIVIDRHFPSEYVYSKVFERESFEMEAFAIDFALAELGFNLIVCEKDLTRIEDEVVKNLEQVQKLKEEYKNYCSKTKMNHLIIDTTEENLEWQIDSIKHFLMEIY